jgi:phosphatidylinositol alpha-1,6-mannosyltransferase
VKILFVCEGLNPSSVVAQPWKHVMEVALRIRRLGIEIEIVTSGSCDLCGGEMFGVPVQVVKKRRLFFDIDSLSRALRQANASVIDWHCSDVWSSIYFWRMRKKIKTSIVWTLHSGLLSIDDMRNLGLSDYFQIYEYWNNFLNVLLPKALVREWVCSASIRHVISLSKRTANKLMEYGLEEKNVTPIPSGVDVNMFKPTGTDHEQHDNILYFGPLNSFRGVDVLFSAFEAITRIDPFARLTVLARGKDENSPWIRKAENLPKAEVVAGVLDQKELVDYLGAASLVVLPFKFWPQVECPSTILEAMAMGKVEVKTSIGAIPEIVYPCRNGMMVPPNDSKRLAKTILSLLNHPGMRDEMGKKARIDIEHFYDWKIITGNTMEVLSRYAN